MWLMQMETVDHGIQARWEESENRKVVIGRKERGQVLEISVSDMGKCGQGE